uniref:NADH dehydrogenase subunit 5 n=1 Tax=Paradiplozoon yunnanensis TaxID=2268894 RepID=UPI001FAF453E|nr:NADH dehydrogenase subunit 5 [Paradiplozoon yunnanensis]UKP90066.1 NADH dehydrogenase subunit 5 [Paradiplozoon yunnanensis]
MIFLVGFFLFVTFLFFGVMDFEFLFGFDFLTKFFFSNYCFSGIILVSHEILLLLYMLICCGLLSWFYSRWYFGSCFDFNLLSVTLFFFVSIVGALFVSGSFLLSLIFWEYLGVVSFFLILFYGNGYGFKSGVITLIFSRLGDLAFFILFSFFFVLDVYLVGLFFLFCLVAGSKSAVFPLVWWLLEAMRAPTPVSALVHSSTLVAGGYWFVLCYGWVFFNSSFNFYFSCFCLFSIFVCSIGSFLLDDLKKIVALSTSINLCWCFVFLLQGDVLLSVFQLVCHGLSKCFLFCLVGDSIRCSLGGQDHLGIYFWHGGGFYLFYYVWNLMSLSGFFFIGSFFGKHSFLALFDFNVVNLLFYFFLYICFFFSVLYHLRSLFLYLGVWGYSCFSYFSLSIVFSFVYFYFFFIFYFGWFCLVDCCLELLDYLNFMLSFLFVFCGFLFFLFKRDVGWIFIGFSYFNFLVFDGWYFYVVYFYNYIKILLDVSFFGFDRSFFSICYKFTFFFWLFGTCGFLLLV